MESVPQQSLSQPRSLRFELLWSVNVILGIGLLAFLAFLYHHELRRRLQDRYQSLHAEAAALTNGVQELRGQGLPEVQEYINATCRLMQSVAGSPRHYIAVRVGRVVLQSGNAAAGPGSFYRAVRRAAESPSHQALTGQRRVMVAAETLGDVQLYVGEDVAGIQRRIRNQILLWLAVIAVLGLVLTAVISMVLIRLVTRPLQRLVAAVRRIGQGHLDADIPNIRSSQEMAFLATAIHTMSTSLAESRRQDQQRIEKARRIQQHLQPPVPIGLDRIAVGYKPAAVVGGDYFDFQLLADGVIMACVADVSGHGVPAAMGAAMLKTLFLAAAAESTDPGQVLTTMNATFTQVALEEDFASIIVVRLDPSRHTLEYASAGHETCYLLRAAAAGEPLYSTGGLMGLTASAQWQSKPLPMNCGDRVVLVTDGLSEAMSPEGQLFGRQKVHDVLTANIKDPLDAIAPRLFAAVELWSQGQLQTDDITVLAVAMA
ncbi:MAG: SpoIIE family protein phosphatase [Phycisphaerae bacterium]|nr:SpoIIE family protein phosphatase [Phycisphaerae bacterium]